MQQTWQHIEYEADGTPVERSSMELVFEVVDLQPMVRDEEFAVDVQAVRCRTYTAGKTRIA